MDTNTTSRTAKAKAEICHNLTYRLGTKSINDATINGKKTIKLNKIPSMCAMKHKESKCLSKLVVYS